MWNSVRVPVVVVGVISAMFIVCPPSALWAQPSAKAFDFSGTVVDWHGRPVEGAEVVGAEQLYDFAAGRIDWGTPSRTTTGADGRFQLRVSAERREYIWVVAWKKGLALGWQAMRNAGDATDLALRLDEPTVLAGTVVDEDGRGIAGATVRVCLKNSWAEGSTGVRFDEPREWFTAQTDAQGRFHFDRIPRGATADFWAEAPGRASCGTYWSGELSSVLGSQFRAGQTDVRIVLKPEAILRGRVVDEDSGKGVAGVRLLARPNTHYANYFCVAPVASSPDGAFVYRGLAANDYSLQVVAPKDRTADWTAKDVKVTTQAGKTVDVNIPVGKGGIIEVAVEDTATGKPIENATVNISQQASFGRCPCWYQFAYTNSEGVARLLAPAGECRLGMWAQAYQYLADPERVVVTKGEVVRRQGRLGAYPTVTGTVRDPNGAPVAGAIVSSRPLCEEAVRTDKQGRFRVQWRPYQTLRGVLILARDPARNLAGLAEVTNPSEPVDVTAAPGFTIRGRVTDPNDRPIPAATVDFRASMPGWLTGMAPAIFTDANGVYVVRAIPAPRDDFRCRIEVHAPRYAPTQLSDLPFAAAQNRRVAARPIIMTPADRSISGVVVDANGVPVPDLPIFISGTRGLTDAGQPRRETVTDQQGRFAVEGVCAGPLRVAAGFGNSPRGSGTLEAQGGDRDVKIVLGRRDIHTGLQPLLGKPLPEWKDLVDLEPEQTKGKPILLCFFDMGQRPSRRCLDLLAEQAEALRGKGVIVAAVQAAATDEGAWKAWVKERGAELPFGQIRKDVEKVKAAWGVQSLPWLILTDKSHRVRAEGFALDDLDNLLKGEKK